MKITVKTLFSGSSGNCTLITAGGRAFLVDAGVSAKRISAALEAEGLSAGGVEALFITHDHVDHVRGVPVMAKKLRLPVFMNEATARACVENGFISPSDFSENLFIFDKDLIYSSGGFEAFAFPVPHDAASAVGFRFEYGGAAAAIATDTGHVTGAMEDGFSGCGTAVIEANHDLFMLENGPYPRWLKERVASPLGHLSNTDCAAFAARLAENGAERIILAHISAENNTPELAVGEVVRAAGDGVYVEAAKRDCLAADGETLCS
ncbi:MAG: MBL fold metallo-hydrolase [Clostridia bacterium]|nr:MBL fold metallo-hydrolase [Clostridia bacterium]